VAPFPTHLMVGEQVWAALGEHGLWAGPDDYGTFLLGCLAPGVDKFCAGLGQATTHFVAKEQELAEHSSRCIEALLSQETSK